jgi:hypothetical protein
MLFYYALLFVGALAQPIIAAIAIAAGLVSRRWWQTALGGAAGGVTGFFYDAPTSGRLLLAAMAIAAGVSWGAFVFALRRALAD